MSQKPNNKNRPVGNAASGSGGARLLPDEVARVREQISGRHSKAALQMAKDLHKRCGSTESEALLVEAYQARIDDLLKAGMTVEAKALMGIVNERFPAAAQRLSEQRRRISALDGKLDEVVGPLGDPNLPAEERNRIEDFIRQRIHDLPALAAVSSLPPEHSLRVAAAALANAFKAVTEGPVEDGILALPEVSRRSPLASWKPLVRAIASYHRREDEECGKWLLAIANDSVPARLIPTLAAMRGSKPKSNPDSAANAKPGTAEAKLVAAAGDHAAALRTALAALEKAFKAKKHKEIPDAIRTVAAVSERCDAKLRERLRQHITVRGAMLRVPVPSMNGALGGPARRDAYFLRLLASGLEEKRHPESVAEAAIVWEEFRADAIKENWFAAGGLEDGVLALHVAQIVRELPDDLVEDILDREASAGKPTSGRQLYRLPLPGAMYQRACEADPHREAFQQWLDWARKQEEWQVADDVAERWRKAQPGEIQPLLYLMESAEKRNAFKKSLKYLEEAENLDRLNPEVRRAKLRLLLSAVIRHFRQHKTHLAKDEIEQIEAVPEVRLGEIGALAAGLRWTSAVVDGDVPAQNLRAAELTESIGSVGAHLLLAALADAADMKYTAAVPPLKVSKVPAAELLAGTVKVCVLGAWAGLAIPLPREWDKPLIAALFLPNCPLDATQLLALGEAALDRASVELAYAVSSVGLARGGADARFFFLRFRSLPIWTELRRTGCLMAALELARQERNTELAGKILDYLNQKKPGRRRWFLFGENAVPGIADRPVPPKLLGQILEEEKELEKFPKLEGNRRPKYESELDSSFCDCPRCRAKRGEPVDDDFSDDEDDLEDGDDFDGDEDEFDSPFPAIAQGMMRMFDELLRALPPEKARQVKAAIAAGEDPIAAIDRVLGNQSPNGRSSDPFKIERKAKTARAPLPGQGTLF